MADTQPPPPFPKSQPSFTRRHSTIIKLIGVGALVLVLLIPLEMITGVLSDRLSRRNEAVADITASWGKEQNVIGPVLGIPYQYKFRLAETRSNDAKWRRSRSRISFPKHSTLRAMCRRRYCIAGFTTRRFFARR